MKRGLPLFFFHIPKTAGSTIQSTLAKHFTADEIVSAGDWTTLLELDPKQLSGAKLVQGHFYGSLEQVAGKQFNTFTILRDPIERALSHYGHILKVQNHYLHPRAVELGSLDAYMEDLTAQKTISNFQSRMLAIDTDVQDFYKKLSKEDRQRWQLEQHVETTDFESSNDKIYAHAQAKLKSFFFVGITERFSATLALLCKELRWKYPVNIADQNVNRDRPLQSQLSHQTIKRLKELNKIDIALYSQACKVFDQKIDSALINVANSSANTSFLYRLFR